MEETEELLEINRLRKSCGMEPISYERVQCRRRIDQTDYTTRQCWQFFTALMRGKRQVDFYCGDCRRFLSHASVERYRIVF